MAAQWVYLLMAIFPQHMHNKIEKQKDRKKTLLNTSGCVKYSRQISKASPRHQFHSEISASRCSPHQGHLTWRWQSLSVTLAQWQNKLTHNARNKGAKNFTVRKAGPITCWWITSRLCVPPNTVFFLLLSLRSTKVGVPLHTCARSEWRVRLCPGDEWVITLPRPSFLSLLYTQHKL